MLKDHITAYTKEIADQELNILIAGLEEGLFLSPYQSLKTKEDFKNALLSCVQRTEAMHNKKRAPDRWTTFRMFTEVEEINWTSYTWTYEQQIGATTLFPLLDMLGLVFKCCVELDIDLLKNIPSYYSEAESKGGEHYRVAEKVQDYVIVNTLSKLVETALWRRPPGSTSKMVFQRTKAPLFDWSKFINGAFEYSDWDHTSNPKGFNMRGLLIKITEQLYNTLMLPQTEIPHLLCCHLYFNRAAHFTGYSSTLQNY
ncbi:MAG: hypothetical protein ACRBFS_24335 [Aureispira sp.]